MVPYIQFKGLIGAMIRPAILTNVVPRIWVTDIDFVFPRGFFYGVELELSRVSRYGAPNSTPYNQRPGVLSFLLAENPGSGAQQTARPLYRQRGR